MSDIVNSQVATNFKKILMNFEQSLLERIEEWRRDQPTIPSRADAIRQLIEDSLSRHEKRQQSTIHKKQRQ